MGRKRKPRTIKPWEMIHDRLADILQNMRYEKATREHIKFVYWGKTEDLRKNCIQILNLIDQTKELEENGLPSENRWT